MDDFEEQIRRVLSDPEQLASVTRMAQAFLGGDAAPPSEPTNGEGALGAKLSKLLGAESGEDRQRQALLRAMQPYLSPRRREKLERALRLTRLGRLAQKAMGEE